VGGLAPLWINPVCERRFDQATFEAGIQLDDQTAACVLKNDEAPGRIVALFGKDLTSWDDKLADRNVSDFLGNPVAPGITHQLLYIPMDEADDLKALFANDSALYGWGGHPCSLRATRQGASQPGHSPMEREITGFYWNLEPQ
jgi:hypothetical protein